MLLMKQINKEVLLSSYKDVLKDTVNKSISQVRARMAIIDEHSELVEP